jgi:hypothetical protein
MISALMPTGDATTGTVHAMNWMALKPDFARPLVVGHRVDTNARRC